MKTATFKTLLNPLIAKNNKREKLVTFHSPVNILPPEGQIAVLVGKVMVWVGELKSNSMDDDANASECDSEA